MDFAALEGLLFGDIVAVGDNAGADRAGVNVDKEGEEEGRDTPAPDSASAAVVGWSRWWCWR